MTGRRRPTLFAVPLLALVLTLFGGAIATSVLAAEAVDLDRALRIAASVDDDDELIALIETDGSIFCLTDRVVFFRPDLHEHSVSRIERGKRVLLSIALHAPWR